MGNYVVRGDSVAFHPGYFVEEIVEDGDLTVQDFAGRIGLPVAELEELIEGRRDVSAEMARKLSDALGTSVAYWLYLQDAYDKALV